MPRSRRSPKGEPHAPHAHPTNSRHRRRRGSPLAGFGLAGATTATAAPPRVVTPGECEEGGGRAATDEPGTLCTGGRHHGEKADRTTARSLTHRAPRSHALRGAPVREKPGAAMVRSRRGIVPAGRDADRNDCVGEGRLPAVSVPRPCGRAGDTRHAARHNPSPGASPPVPGPAFSAPRCAGGAGALYPVHPGVRARRRRRPLAVRQRPRRGRKAGTRSARGAHRRTGPRGAVPVGCGPVRVRHDPVAGRGVTP